ncbi:MAG: aminoacyl--tRNA ligase-related protein [bacterium]|nr:aminoacyl--tRNA ligase-related protein [bacterium]
MKQSELFTKTRREAPSDEASKNAKLLIRGGFIHKEMSGVYSLLPLGLIVMEKIANVVREEMKNIGGQEVRLSAMQSRELWEKTDRWDDKKVDIWFKSDIKNGAQIGLGFTHEEPLTAIMREHVSSYKDLPKYIFQIQTKFRNEERAKSGILRGREFLMKDFYSFSRNEEEHKEFYEKAAKSYGRIFNRVGIGECTFRTFASGGVFSKFSDEFQTLSEVGEDVIFLDEKNKTAINSEVFTDETLSDLGKQKGDFVEKKSIEVGNIFSLGSRFSEPLGLKFKNENGAENVVIMGSYGIGIGRLMGTVAEILSDGLGLVWPKEISPFDLHLVSIGAEKSAKVKKQADELYEGLLENGVDVLYDDRDLRAGEKFADSDLLGIPTRVVISEKTMGDGKVEVKERIKKEALYMTEKELLETPHYRTC